MRVLVNRVWAWHFGRGLVETPSDRASQRRSAVGIPNCSTGWQGSLSAAAGSSNRCIASSCCRPPTARPAALDARPCPWTAAIGCCGGCAAAVGGGGGPRRCAGGQWPSRPSHGRPRLQPVGEEHQLRDRVPTRKAILGPEEFRRMVYQFKPRSDSRIRRLASSTAPTASLVSGRGVPPRRRSSRPSTCSTVALFLTRRSSSRRLRREAGEDPVRQTEAAFRLAFGRRPTDRELHAAAALIRSHGTAALCRAPYNANEFLHVD